MSLYSELIKEEEESYNKWFERWYEKQNLENSIKISNKQGYTGFNISIKNKEETERNFKEDRMYLVRRLRDERTVNKIKEKLGHGMNVKKKTNEYSYISVFNNTVIKEEEMININWRN